MKTNENYLDKKPLRNPEIEWKTNESEIIVLEIKNKGVFNKIAQKLFKKPPVSYVTLDEMGSFIWPVIDGEKDITAIGVLVEEHFGEKANPLYERLAKYFQILHSYGFIKFN